MVWSLLFWPYENNYYGVIYFVNKYFQPIIFVLSLLRRRAASPRLEPRARGETSYAASSNIDVSCISWGSYLAEDKIAEMLSSLTKNKVRSKKQIQKYISSFNTTSNYLNISMRTRPRVASYTHSSSSLFSYIRPQVYTRP